MGGARSVIKWAMFLVLPPAQPLASLVQSYWFIEDLAGEHQGRPIRTSPVPTAVLSVNIGRPNAAEDGTLVPAVSLLGVQSRARSWHSWSETYFVMVMLTVPGLVRLFPNLGLATRNHLLDLGSMMGDALSRRLSRGVTAAIEPARICQTLDRWLLERLSATQAVSEVAQMATAHATLRAGGSVEQAAQAAGADRRQLLRWFNRHTGVGPKELADLERLQQSLRCVQTNRGDSVTGFSDQAHQIRSWRRRLGVTPGRYGTAVPSPLAAYFSAVSNGREPAFYL